MTKKIYRGSMTATLPDGTKQRVYARGATKKEMKEKLLELYNELAENGHKIDRRLTVQEWGEEWLRVYKEPNVSKGWLISINRVLSKHVYPSIGNLFLADVKPIHIQKIMNDTEVLSENYIRQIYAVTKDLFNRAEQNRLINHNPAASVSLPKGKPAMERRELTAEEQKRLWKACQTHPAGAFFGIMLACGLRPQEAAALTRFHVDLKNQTIHVRQAFDFTTKTIKPPKSKAGDRIIPVPDWYMPMLTAAIKETPFSEFLFTDKGKPFFKHIISRRWKSVARQAKLPEELTPYYLRHTYATNLAENGVDMKTAQRLLGHANIQMTAKVYTHVSAKMFETAREKINAAAPI